MVPGIGMAGSYRPHVQVLGCAPLAILIIAVQVEQIECHMR